MDQESSPDRRRYRRYLAQGRVEFDCCGQTRSAELCNVGQGGLLIRGEDVVPKGAETAMKFTVRGYPIALEVRAEVISRRDEFTAVRFTAESREVIALLAWLHRENYPWTTLAPADSTMFSKLGQAV
ncbi:MAG: PilZ domain-containing protein [Acidobacteria bacterium]|nr:PilZ domain-containing protein [Acidobacteriota bacterium]